MRDNYPILRSPPYMKSLDAYQRLLDRIKLRAQRAKAKRIARYERDQARLKNLEKN